MQHTSPDNLLDDLGRLLGIAGLAFDEHGYCCLAFGDTLVNLERDLQSRELLFYVELAPLSEPMRADTLLDLLQANHYAAMTGAGALGVDRTAARWYLSARLRFDGLEGDGLVARLRDFLDRVDGWKRLLATASSAGHVEDSAQQSTITHLDLPFIRV